MPVIHFTELTIKAFPCPSEKRKTTLFDSQTRGLTYEKRSSGTATFYLRYADKRGKTRYLKLGRASDITLKQARTLADKARSKIAMGEDPVEQKRIARSVPTFSQFVEQQYIPYIRGYKRSWLIDVSLLKLHLLPRFGSLHLDAITREQIQKMHTDHVASGAAAASANRLLTLMRYIFNLALRWDVPGLKTNPSAHVPMMQLNNQRERYLSKEETKRLYDAVCTSQNTMLRFIVPMLILTGARKREVLDARWEDLDLERRTWRIPTTKAGKARHVPLSDGALYLLSSMPRIEGCPWAFANLETGKPFNAIYDSWDRARTKAGLADVRLHDLRHSFASLLVNGGRTLYEVQRILGHSQSRTTQRYAHLNQDTLIAAANTATLAVGSVMGVSPPHALDVPRGHP